MTPLEALQVLSHRIAQLEARNQKLEFELLQMKVQGNDRQHIICVCPDCLKKKG